MHPATWGWWNLVLHVPERTQLRGGIGDRVSTRGSVLGLSQVCKQNVRQSNNASPSGLGTSGQPTPVHTQEK